MKEVVAPYDLFVCAVIAMAILAIKSSLQQKRSLTHLQALRGLQPSSSRPAADCPAGTYLTWPVPASIVLLILGLVGAAQASGGTQEGLFLAAALNPILWFAFYSYWAIGKIRCPHCRKAFRAGRVAKQSVGSAIECGNCRNVFTKPLG